MATAPSDPGPRRWPLLAALLAVLLALAAALAAWWPRHGAPAKVPLVVIGIDGGEWRVLRRLWQDGELPHLRRLAAHGSTARPRTADNASPGIWATLPPRVTPPQPRTTRFLAPRAHP